jgi:hypothetical protein
VDPGSGPSTIFDPPAVSSSSFAAPLFGQEGLSGIAEDQDCDDEDNEESDDASEFEESGGEYEDEDEDEEDELDYGADF